MKNARNLQEETLVRQRYSDATGLSRKSVHEGASSPAFRTAMPAVKESLATISRRDSIAHLEAAVLARLDGEKRLSAVEALKARVRSDTYQINNRALAQILQRTPFIQAMVCCKRKEEGETSF
jgi:hypothetical protein